MNTNWDLFNDGSEYFLLTGKTWLKSKEPSGPWTATTKLPAEMAKLPKGQNWDGVLKQVPPPAGAPPAPKVFFTERPVRIDRLSRRASLRSDPRHKSFLRDEHRRQRLPSQAG